MKTKQEKIAVKLGPLRIRANGSMLSDTAKQLYHVRNRLKDFLNLDCDNRNAVDNFCKRFAYLPSDVSMGWQEAVRNEQQKVRTFIDKINKGQITQSDLDFLDYKTRDVRKKRLLLSLDKFKEIERELKLMNGNKAAVIDTNQLDKDQIIIESYFTTNAEASIWNEVSQQLLAKIQYRKCQVCKQFYFPNKHTPWQKRCESCTQKL